ncbi:hypothetical protein D3C87_716140 [compost metagenome]
MKVAVPAFSLITGVAEMLTLAASASVMFTLAGVLSSVIAGLSDAVKVAITVSVPSANASANTGMVMVAVVAPAGIIIVLVTAL